MPATTHPHTTAQCRRRNCARPTVGRGLCLEHYGRWQLEHDPLTLPGDTAPPPAQAIWRPPHHPRPLSSSGPLR